MTDLIVKASVTVEGDAASAGLNKLTGETARLEGAQRKLAQSAGQVRAATANLGQQIGDISQGLAAGTSAATIFGQQAGQVAFAISGMGGALGRIGTFLTGPFGAALTGAVIILGSMAAAHSKAAGSADDHTAASNAQKEAADRLKDAIRDLDTITGKNTRTIQESAAAALQAAQATVTQITATREAIKAELSRQDAVQKGIDLAARRGGFAGAGAIQTGQAAGGFKRTTLQEQLAEQDFLAAGARLSVERTTRQANLANAIDRVRLSNDKAAAAERTRETAIKALNGEVLTAAQYNERVRKIEDTYAATIERLSSAKKAATAAGRERNAELRESTREAEKAAAATKLLADATAELFSRKGPTIGSLSFGEGLNARGEVLGAERLSQITAGIAGDGGAAKEAGQKVAEGFRDGALADAAALGQIIGGKAGQAFAGIAALGFGSKGPNGVTRDLTGAGGRLEKLLSPLGEAFGNGGKRFAGLVGQAAGGAATGSVVSGIAGAVGISLNKTGSSIGGAIGSFIPIPGGEIIGSILGGIAGNLLSVKQGSTTVSSSGGKISQSSTGDKSIQKATGAIGNTISDAIQSIADQLGAEIGSFSVSIGKRNDSFRVDRSGTGKIRGRTVTGTKDEGEALQLAIADALSDGAIVTTPRVQAALLRYSDNVNKAVAEALKVKGLEDLLADRSNPFASAFRQLELQLKQRLRVAQENGFDLVEIEKINGEDRARVVADTLGQATGSIKALLADLQFGSRATGSASERLAGLVTERDRLTALARGGDTGQLDAIAGIVQQIDQLQRETFGSTGGFASGRAESVSLLNDLIRQTEERVKAAADAARGATDTTNAKLTEANASLDDLVNGVGLTNAQLQQLIALGGFSGGGGIAFDAREFQR